jgi:hypothetical protein
MGRVCSIIEQLKAQKLSKMVLFGITILIRIFVFVFSNQTKLIATTSVHSILFFGEVIGQPFSWKVQTDTYKRELERYGEATMVDS